MMNFSDAPHPALKQQFYKCDRDYANLCKSIRKQKGYVVDWPLVDSAWEMVKQHHGTELRETGELALLHSQSVMAELAKLCCKSSVLASALLHDVMEGARGISYEQLREGFSEEVAQIVSAVTVINSAEVKDPHFDSMAPADQQAHLDRLNDAKLIASPYQREAFLVRFADCLQNLSTVSGCSNEEQSKELKTAQSFLIPAAHKLNMRYFETILSDRCMKLNGKEYDELINHRTALTKVSGSAHSRLDQILLEAMEKQSIFSYPQFNPFATLRGYTRIPGQKEEMVAVSRRVLLPYELKQQLTHNSRFERSQLDLFEIILTSKHNTRDMLKYFIDLHRCHLNEELFFLTYISGDDNSIVLRLTDALENNYRIILIPEGKLETYFIGSPDEKRLTLISEDAPGDSLRPKITVYSYSPKKGYRKYENVPYGATALDFAFIISSALAVTVKSAWIHKWKSSTVSFSSSDHAYPLRTILSDDDVVYFNADYHPPIPGDVSSQKVSIPHAAIDWFAFINTEYARHCLIKYLQGKYHE